MSPAGMRRTTSSKSNSHAAIERQPEPYVTVARSLGHAWQHSEYQQLRSAKKEIIELMQAKADAEAQLEDCIKQLEIEQGMLDAELASGVKPTPGDMLGRKAYRLGIKAWKASIKAFRNDIEGYSRDIEATKKALPPDLLEYLPEDREEPDYPLLAINEIPKLLEGLAKGAGYPRFATLMFVPKDSKDGEYVNIQYSVENEVVGLDWVLLGGRNREDQEKVMALTKRLGHDFLEYEMTGVRYLRIEGPGSATLADLGIQLMQECYGMDSTTTVKLLVQGFQWKDSTGIVESYNLSAFFGAQKERLSAELAKREIPRHRPEGAVDRNILRLMGMVHELHKQGWQKIRIRSGMSASGCYWRCAIFPGDLAPRMQERYDTNIGPGTLVANYTTGQERNYFEWTDCGQDDARHLAQKFLERFPRICELGRGRDWAYAGWFSELLGHAESGRVPISYWDDMTPGAEQAVWLSFGEEIPFPLPPPLGQESNFWPTQVI